MSNQKSARKVEGESEAFAFKNPKLLAAAVGTNNSIPSPAIVNNNSAPTTERKNMNLMPEKIIKTRSLFLEVASIPNKGSKNRSHSTYGLNRGESDVYLRIGSWSSTDGAQKPTMMILKPNVPKVIRLSVSNFKNFRYDDPARKKNAGIRARGIPQTRDGQIPSTDVSSIHTERSATAKRSFVIRNRKQPQSHNKSSSRLTDTTKVRISRTNTGTGDSSPKKRSNSPKKERSIASHSPLGKVINQMTDKVEALDKENVSDNDSEQEESNRDEAEDTEDEIQKYAKEPLSMKMSSLNSAINNHSGKLSSIRQTFETNLDKSDNG
eukprot:CAMPEP_0115031602 /NCGR_PEP_ID=MMETSP0216-20121206/38638_1 /TAXON_ID=223996 /ORGANISM="Protocruzia adherens, Strain Boccale" /LENGTH=322 /DNA_ID=CAMNT_0002409297 /DNA_START=61 /DNA_END=1026 /DNA_ORIENTATION=-